MKEKKTAVTRTGGRVDAQRDRYEVRERGRGKEV